jgi:DnaJ family protein C protein 19
VLFQAGSVIVAGLGLAAVGFAGRYILRAVPGMSQKMSETMKSLSKLDSSVRENK